MQVLLLKDLRELLWDVRDSVAGWGWEGRKRSRQMPYQTAHTIIACWYSLSIDKLQVFCLVLVDLHWFRIGTGSLRKMTKDSAETQNSLRLRRGRIIKWSYGGVTTGHLIFGGWESCGGSGGRVA